MSSDELYESCLPILKDDSLEDEDKTERIEEYIRKESSLTGKALEAAVLEILWRYRNAGVASSSSPAITVRKSASPAPWQMSRSGTPSASPRSTTASPVPGSLSAKRPGIFRVKSSNAGSPFSSPRPSPSLAYVAPRATQSPSQNLHTLNDTPLPTELYGDFGSDDGDWLIGEDGSINNTYSSAGYGGDIAPSVDWMPSQNIEMSPYDILRSVLRDQRSDEEIEKVLEANAYDLSASIASLMDTSADPSHLTAALPEQDATYLVGNSVAPTSRPATPAGQAKTSVVCRYWLQTGQCLRADCRFSHDLSNHVCKYWLQGNCLAGDSCIFSHDPSSLLGNLSINNTSSTLGASDSTQSSYELHDHDAFPSLIHNQNNTESSIKAPFLTNGGMTVSSGFSSGSVLAPEFVPSRPQSRPSSRHQSPAPRASAIAFDDSEAFPALGAAAARTSKKHHGKRGHGHSHREKDNSSNLLADVVRNAPNPPASSRRTLRGRGAFSNGKENSAAIQAIPAPDHIPWLETGDRANKAYLKARQDAIKHGNARNKFLQSAAQAWHRQDVRAAKALSLRGQSENDLMREAHRVAADALYEERNKHLQSASASPQEIFIDLHGLHPAEAVSYLSTALSKQRAAYSKLSSRLTEEESSRSKVKYLYAIVGTGHHSRSGGSVGTASGSGGKDKVGRAVRSYLSECGYAFKEFGAPQEQLKGTPGPGGGILGIDVITGDASRDPSTFGIELDDGEDDAAGTMSLGIGNGNGVSHSPESSSRQGRIRVLKADDLELA